MIDLRSLKLYGGFFPTVKLSALVQQAVARWHVGSGYSKVGRDLAATDEKLRKLRKRLEVLQRRAMRNIMGGTGAAKMFGSSGSSMGIGAAIGAGGMGLRGTGAGGGGGGGAGMGTIGGIGRPKSFGKNRPTGARRPTN